MRSNRSVWASEAIINRKMVTQKNVALCELVSKD